MKRGKVSAVSLLIVAFCPSCIQSRIETSRPYGRRRFIVCPHEADFPFLESMV
ncbi:MAG: hypothetical protein PHC49_13765 [Desulfuromonadaceae bacterium]|nr:hypothetical protein [Desulfuromonadaceae bacterium]